MEEVKFGPVGREVYERTYRRVMPNGELETWRDTVRRVVDGNLDLVDSRFIEDGEREKLIELMSDFKALPAGRHLWVSGVPGRQFLFNCHRAAFEGNLSTHYAFTFDELMKGGGVGANYSNRYIEHFPILKNGVDLHIVCRDDHPDYSDLDHMISDSYSHLWDGATRIEDSREGWVLALTSVIDAYLTEEPITLVLDVSLVRGKGEPIRGFGGTASGPAALIEMLHNINNLLQKRTGQTLNSLDHMTLDHFIAECVVAGNVRRSARMSIKSWQDDDILDFINCKQETDYHWSTNISVEIDDEFFNALKRKRHPLHNRAEEVYDAVVTGMLLNGEPGFYNLSLASEGEYGDVGSTNPCGEIALEPWENCNLGHINISAFANDFEGSKEAFRLMARFLIRATFSDITNPMQAEVVKRNRRIGVGFFGYHSWLVKQGIRYSDSHRDRYVRKTLRDWKAVVDKEKVRYACQLRIPVPIKGTTLAPTGSISQLPGETQSLQPVYAPYFKRRIRFSNITDEWKEYEAKGYEIEDCIYTENTKVVTFYTQDPIVEMAQDEDLVEGAFDISFADMLAVQAMMQECYADNAISFTINIIKDSISLEEAKSTLIHYLPHLKGTTVFPELSRPQSPLEVISKAEYELAQYIKEMGQGELACGPNACPIK